MRSRLRSACGAVLTPAGAVSVAGVAAGTGSPGPVDGSSGGECFMNLRIAPEPIGTPMGGIGFPIGWPMAYGLSFEESPKGGNGSGP